MNDRLEQCLNLLGVNPGASLEEINTAYFMILKRLPENPTEEDEEYQNHVVQAYAFIKRSYVPPPAVRVRLPLDRSFLTPVAIVLVIVLAVSVLVMNFGTLRVMMTRYEPGVTLRWRNQTETYGQVVAYEPGHRFENGEPFAAYQIRLAAHDEKIWLSENLVVRGMVQVEGRGGSVQPASVTPGH